jgi:hypothetical protein
MHALAFWLLSDSSGCTALTTCMQSTPPTEPCSSPTMRTFSADSRRCRLRCWKNDSSDGTSADLDGAYRMMVPMQRSDACIRRHN